MCIRDRPDPVIFHNGCLLLYDLPCEAEFSQYADRYATVSYTHLDVYKRQEYAGWYEGRSVDMSIAEKYDADHGVPMMKTTQRFYRKYFGLCGEWYLAQKKLKWAADFEFALFPYLVLSLIHI